MRTPNETTGRTRVKPRGETVVRRVLAVALEQLAARGYHGLSVPDVATAAGVNKTSIYRRWPTKGQLVSAALNAALGHEADPPDTGTLRGDILEIARRGLGFAQSTLGRSVLKTLLADGGDDEISGLVGGLVRQQGHSGPRAVFFRALERGELASGTDLPLLMSILAGTLMHRVFIERGHVTDEELERLVEVVLYGVLAKPGR